MGFAKYFCVQEQRGYGMSVKAPPNAHLYLLMRGGNNLDMLPSGIAGLRGQ